jgi:hypothetical protein
MKTVALIFLVTCWPASAVNLISSLTVSTGTLSITATSPDSGPFSITGGATWNVLINIFGDAWTLNLQATSASFASCSNVPLSAVRVTCTSITDSGLTGVTHSCAPAFNLSTSNQLLASGTDPAVGILASHTVNLQFTFTDSWKYPGSSSSCNVNLNYTLIAT